ncbi:MAG: hypothetical protein HYZ90_02465 [Candidatus Omnitrophica bacterium]|nr:hypothetical protein [Candidatus Omnitrophota bacterium]
MSITNQKYVDLYSQLHSAKEYGQSCHEFSLQILACILDLKPAAVLEYGCGQSALHKTIGPEGIRWVRYDPAIPSLSDLTITRCDLVINTDVMEHIPEQDVDDVLAHIRSFSENVFFNIATRPAKEILPNGENAHCTVWSSDQWLNRIKKHFPCAEVVFSYPLHSCVIITWRSSVSRVISEIERLKQAARRPPPDPIYKRILRKARRVMGR